MPWSDPSPEDATAGPAGTSPRARAADALDDARACRAPRAAVRSTEHRTVTYAGAVDSEAAALLDALPDGVVVADADGTVTVVNETARRLLGPAAVAVGRHLREVMALQDQESCDWYASNTPYDGLGSRVGLTEQAWLTSDGTEVLVTGRINRPVRFGPGGERRAGDPLGPRPRPARPRPLRPGRHGRPRAALAADRREGLRRRRC